VTIEFKWNVRDAEALLATCDVDGVFPLIEKYIPKGSRVLESGCGLGRYVKYLHDRGWDAIGLECSRETVDQVRQIWPELPVVVGDAAAAPFPDASFDGIVSLGVVEHWPDGPARPLQDIHRLLKPGGCAVISVPVLNAWRRWKRKLWWDEVRRLPNVLWARLAKGKRKPLTRLNPKYRYAVAPTYGDFFEYRMTVREYRQELQDAGFQVLEHLPLGTIDGLYQDLNPFGLLVRFKDWEFLPSRLGSWLNRMLARQPFRHCHMQVAVVRKGP
jgi:SAM-dependent methyltransferase